ncbi:MAG: hypothetical protein Q8P76_03275 [bacterium]|nr:hypothetical protein [bacterium]
MKLFPLRIKKDTKIALIILLAVVAIYFWVQYVVASVFVPDNFTEARKSSAAVSAEIISVLDESLKTLQTISERDQNYAFSSALKLVSAEIDRTKESKKKATELTLALDKMARAVPEISPSKARNLAVEAVSSAIALISHLVIYNDSLNGLLDTLRYKFSGDIRYDAKDVQVMVQNMNREAKEINALNDLFNQKMREFDEVTK